MSDRAPRDLEAALRELADRRTGVREEGLHRLASSVERICENREPGRSGAGGTLLLSFACAALACASLLLPSPAGRLLGGPVVREALTILESLEWSLSNPRRHR